MKQDGEKKPDLVVFNEETQQYAQTAKWQSPETTAGGQNAARQVQVQ